jgi:hypothetical protein
LFRRGWASVTSSVLLALGALVACRSFDAAPDTSAENDGGELGQDAQPSVDAAADAKFQIDAETDADARAPGNPSDGVCDAGLTYRGSFATWYGKVNVHTLPNGTWARDDDCLSGALVDPFVYCKKWWPTSTTVVEETLDPGPKPFWNQGCEMVAEFAGEHQYECCASP